MISRRRTKKEEKLLQKNDKSNEIIIFYLVQMCNVQRLMIKLTTTKFKKINFNSL